LDGCFHYFSDHACESFVLFLSNGGVGAGVGGGGVGGGGVGGGGVGGVNKTLQKRHGRLTVPIW